MKKNHIYLLTTLILACSLFGCKGKVSDERKSEVVVYTYDSFSGEWGAGPEIARLFEAKTGLKVTYADCGSSVQALTKAILEKDDPVADVIVGLDNNLIEQVTSNKVLVSYKPKNSDVLADGLEAELGGNWLMTPYDYSEFSFIYDSESDIPQPKCLEDLTSAVYSKKVILMDAKTSTVGVGFEAWVNAVYGEKAADYMKRLEPSILTVAPGWSVGYGMFTKGEAPLVISYETSPAYHVEYGEGNRFKAIAFTDGHVRQVESAGVIANAKNPDGAKQFIDFLISEEAQKIIPTTQWMYPANKNVELPASYAELPKLSAVGK